MKVKDFVELMSDETVYLPIAEHRMDDCLLSKKGKLVSKFGYYGMRKEFVEEEHHYCMSTKGWEACTCGGDKNKCDHCGKEE